MNRYKVIYTDEKHVIHTKIVYARDAYGAAAVVLNTTDCTIINSICYLDNNITNMIVNAVAGCREELANRIRDNNSSVK